MLSMMGSGVITRRMGQVRSPTLTVTSTVATGVTTCATVREVTSTLKIMASSVAIGSTTNNMDWAVKNGPTKRSLKGSICEGRSKALASIIGLMGVATLVIGRTTNNTVSVFST